MIDEKKIAMMEEIGLLLKEQQSSDGEGKELLQARVDELQKDFSADYGGEVVLLQYGGEWEIFWKIPKSCR